MSFYVPNIGSFTEHEFNGFIAHIQSTAGSKPEDTMVILEVEALNRTIKAQKARKDLAMVEQSIQSREAFEDLVDAQALMPLPVAPEEIQRLPYHLTHGISNFNADSAIYGDLPAIFGQTKPMVIKCKAKKPRKVRRQFSRIPKALRLIKKARAVVAAARRPVEAKVKVEAPVEVKVETDVVVKTSSGRSIKRRVVLDV